MATEGTVEIATTTTEVYKLVAELKPEERRRVFSAVSALCGDTQQAPLAATTSVQSLTPPSDEFATLPAKAGRWLSQNKIALTRVQDVFHIDGGQAELILSDMPGSSQRIRTTNCYLMQGVASLLSTGEATINEASVVALCKRFKCYDKNNHATYRKQAANYLAGDKDKGFVLSAPGLRAAAEAIRAAQ